MNEQSEQPPRRLADIISDVHELTMHRAGMEALYREREVQLQVLRDENNALAARIIRLEKALADLERTAT